MQVALLFPTYVRWHYSQALSDIISIWKSFLGFIWRFFSITFLLHSLFAPFERMGESYGRGFENVFGTFVVNSIMRFIGAVARAFIITVGLILYVLCVLGGFCVLIFWILLPAFVFWLAVWSLVQLS